jgi:hypothetical protein
LNRRPPPSIESLIEGIPDVNPMFAKYLPLIFAAPSIIVLQRKEKAMITCDKCKKHERNASKCLVKIIKQVKAEKTIDHEVENIEIDLCDFCISDIRAHLAGLIQKAKFQ